MFLLDGTSCCNSWRYLCCHSLLLAYRKYNRGDEEHSKEDKGNTDSETGLAQLAANLSLGRHFLSIQSVAKASDPGEQSGNDPVGLVLRRWHETY